MIALLPYLALALIGVAIVSAVGALMARSLFVSCMHLTAAGVCTSAATTLVRGGDGALAFALFAAAWAPVLLLAAMLLSARSARAARTKLPWVSLLGALAAALALWWPLVDLRSATAAAPPHPVVALSFWLAPLVFAVAIACLGALGYGERGALARRAEP